MSQSGHGINGGKQIRVITDIAELDKLTSLRAISINPSAVSLNLASIRTEESRHWQTIINRHLSACGCKEGGLFVISVVGAYIAYLSLHHSGTALQGWTSWGLGFGIACAGAALGKSTGLLRARWLLRRAVRQLKAVIDSRS
jgi:hypothetical protein